MVTLTDDDISSTEVCVCVCVCVCDEQVDD